MADSDQPSQENVIPAKKPHDLIKGTDVQIALRADKGANAVLIAYAIKDFTTKGDNYQCIVSSVQVTFRKGEKEQETSYVVKLNPCLKNNFMDKQIRLAFTKESGFYTQVLPLLNGELQKVKEPNLRVPKHYHSVLSEKEEVIYLEDLRTSGYKMRDRKLGMDKNHTNLILKELARMHAASVLLTSRPQYKIENLVKDIPVFQEIYKEWFNNESLSDGMFDRTFEQNAGIAEKNKGYEYAGEFLRSLKGKSQETLTALLEAEEPFRFICHGDCWNNNFLFRYDSSGNPTECKLLDMQIIRIGSPALDINYMFFSSLNADVRRENLQDFFHNYYATFASVMAAAKRPMKFTLGRLRQEYKAKHLFGLFMGLFLIPIVLMDSEDAPSMDEIDMDNMEKAMADYEQKMAEIIQKNPLLKPRLLSMYDDMNEAGVIRNNSVLKLIDNFNKISE